jgi:hypothetical protein
VLNHSGINFIMQSVCLGSRQEQPQIQSKTGAQVMSLETLISQSLLHLVLCAFATDFITYKIHFVLVLNLLDRDVSFPDILAHVLPYWLTNPEPMSIAEVSSHALLVRVPYLVH